MRLSNTKFVLLLILVICFISTKIVAKHHDKHDHNCDHDEDEDKEDWEDEDWEDEEEDGNHWDEKSNDWDKNHDDNWNGNDNWDNNRNDQGWNSGYRPSGEIAAGESTIWSSSGWIMPTNSYDQPSYPTHVTPGVVTATQTQVVPINPTNIKSEPQVGNSASVKSMGVPVLLAAVVFGMFIVA